MWYCFDFKGTNTTPSDRAAILGYLGQRSPGTKLQVRMGLPLYPWHWWHQFCNPQEEVAVGVRDGMAKWVHAVTLGLCVSGSKPNRKDMLLQDTFVILLEVLKTKLGERHLLHSDTPPWAGTSHYLRTVVQAQNCLSAATETPLMTDAM